jgi:hypothetical protein
MRRLRAQLEAVTDISLATIKSFLPMLLGKTVPAQT